MKARFKALIPAAVMLILTAVCFSGISSAASQEAKSGKYPLPVYGSKPVKHGLFAEELISVRELREIQELKGTVTIFDARSKRDYDLAHIQGAVLPLTPGFYEKEELYRKGVVKNPPDRESSLRESMKRYAKDTPIVTYCSVDCQASAVLLIQLKQQGFTNVRALSEGFQVWQEAGYPVGGNAGA